MNRIYNRFTRKRNFVTAFSLKNIVNGLIINTLNIINYRVNLNSLIISKIFRVEIPRK